MRQESLRRRRSEPVEGQQGRPVPAVALIVDRVELGAVIDELYPEKRCIGGKIRAVPWVKEQSEIAVTDKAVRKVE